MPAGSEIRTRFAIANRMISVHDSVLLGRLDFLYNRPGGRGTQSGSHPGLLCLAIHSLNFAESASI
jgi:hypothetical protein